MGEKNEATGLQLRLGHSAAQKEKRKNKLGTALKKPFDIVIKIFLSEQCKKNLS